MGDRERHEQPQGLKDWWASLKVATAGRLLSSCFIDAFWRYFMAEDTTKFDLAVLESELKGKTLLVYWYLLQRPSHTVGAREVQRALGFSSPSISVHHLEKLHDLKLIRKKPTGEYVLVEEVKVGILRFFTRMGHFLVPRYLFYSVLMSTMLVVYLALCVLTPMIPSYFALAFGTVAGIILWVETARLWRSKPF